MCISHLKFKQITCALQELCTTFECLELPRTGKIFYASTISTYSVDIQIRCPMNITERSITIISDNISRDCGGFHDDQRRRETNVTLNTFPLRHKDRMQQADTHLYDYRQGMQCGKI